MGKARGGPGGHGGHWRLVVGAVVLAMGLAPQPAGARVPVPQVQALARAEAAGGSWSLTRSMMTARAFFTLTLLPSGQVLAAGGGTGSSGDSTTSAELYSPRRGTWRVTGSLRYARQSYTATVLRSGQVLVAGGDTADVGLSSAELYSPATGRFAYTRNNMATLRVYHAAAPLPNGQVLVAGGCDGDFFGCTATWSSADLYDPTTQTFTATGNMTQARQFHTATLLPSGQVLVAGGAGCGGCLATNEADLYDPASGTFRPNLGLLAAPRALHTATVLQNGQVLLAGGCLAVDGPTCATANVLASAELYDPTTGTWTPTAPMAVARAFAAATALPGGGVLVAGGCPGEYTGGECRGDVASAEIYQ